MLDVLSHTTTKLPETNYKKFTKAQNFFKIFKCAQNSMKELKYNFPVATALSFLRFHA